MMDYLWLFQTYHLISREKKKNSGTRCLYQQFTFLPARTGGRYKGCVRTQTRVSEVSRHEINQSFLKIHKVDVGVVVHVCSKSSTSNNALSITDSRSIYKCRIDGVLEAKVGVTPRYQVCTCKLCTNGVYLSHLLKLFAVIKGPPN